MTPTPGLLKVVALTEDIPARRLIRGQVGTVVEILTPDTFEVEFSTTKDTLTPWQLSRRLN